MKRKPVYDVFNKFGRVAFTTASIYEARNAIVQYTDLWAYKERGTDWYMFQGDDWVATTADDIEWAEPTATEEFLGGFDAVLSELQDLNRDFNAGEFDRLGDLAQLAREIKNLYLQARQLIR